MIVVPVTDWLPVLNTEPRATVTPLLTVKLASLLGDPAFVPTIPAMLTAPVPAVRFSVCAPSTVPVKLMPPLPLLSRIAAPSSTGSLNVIFPPVVVTFAFRLIVAAPAGVNVAAPPPVVTTPPMVIAPSCVVTSTTPPLVVIAPSVTTFTPSRNAPAPNPVTVTVTFAWPATNWRRLAIVPRAPTLLIVMLPPPAVPSSAFAPVACATDTPPVPARTVSVPADPSASAVPAPPSSRVTMPAPTLLLTSSAATPPPKLAVCTVIAPL